MTLCVIQKKKNNKKNLTIVAQFLRNFRPCLLNERFVFEMWTGFVVKCRHQGKFLYETSVQIPHVSGHLMSVCIRVRFKQQQKYFNFLTAQKKMSHRQPTK